MTVRPWLPWSLLALRLVFLALLQARPLNPSLYSSLSWRLIGNTRGTRGSSMLRHRGSMPGRMLGILSDGDGCLEAGITQSVFSVALPQAAYLVSEG